MNIRLTVMTRELCREYHRGFAYDPAMFPHWNCSKQYVYDEQRADAHWQRQLDLKRIHLAIMLDNRVIGDAVLKSIDQNPACSGKVGFRETHRSNGFVYYVCEKAGWTDREIIYKHL